MARLMNLAILVLEILAFRICLSRVPKNSAKERLRLLTYYTVLSNLAAMPASLLYAVLGPVPAAIIVRYLATCMLTMTLMVVILVLTPASRKPRQLLLMSSELYMHTLCPLLSLLSWCLFEEPLPGRGWVLLPVLVTLGYGILMLLLNARRIVDGPYLFFRVRERSVFATCLWMAGLVAFIALLAFALSFL